MKPIAGVFAHMLFAIGIVGTDLLAVPVLGGSAAYAVGEALKSPTGLNRKLMEAKAFYATIAVATLIGLGLISRPSIRSRRSIGAPSSMVSWLCL